jgi:hypothetical protein
MNRLRLLWVAIQVTCCSSILYAQKLDVASLQAEASKLRIIYKKDDVAALQSTSVYDFVIQDVSMVAKEHEVAEYISLKANTNFVIRNYYNDNSFIESYTLQNEKGRTFIHDKLCGHYKQGDIFYSDAQVCAYRLAMNTQGQYARFESTTVFKDPKYLTYIFLHSPTPAKKREIVLNIPEWANV